MSKRIKILLATLNRQMEWVLAELKNLPSDPDLELAKTEIFLLKQKLELKIGDESNFISPDKTLEFFTRFLNDLKSIDSKKIKEELEVCILGKILEVEKSRTRRVS